jgi:putative endopeptidase
MGKAHDTSVTSRLDWGIRPQDDFFGFVNQKWIQDNPIPDNESWNGTFQTLSNNVWANMHAIYETLYKGAATPKTPRQQARDFYFTGMHFDALQAAHLACINSYLDQIDNVHDVTSLCRMIGLLEGIGVSSLWSSYVHIDNQDATKHIFHLTQPSLTLPDRDYYLLDTPEMKSIRGAYELHTKKVYKHFQSIAQEANGLWDTIWDIELGLAKHCRDGAALRDVDNNYNRRSYALLKDELPTIDWQAYATALGWQTGEDLSVDQPEFFSFLQEQLDSRPLDAWKIYLKWRFIAAYYGMINETFASMRFTFFGKVLSGTPTMLPLWERVVRTLDNCLGECVGRLYVEKHFPESSKQQVLRIVEDIRETYGERIEGLDWMSAGTKKKALQKLKNIKVLIGYPEQWRDYTALDIGRTSYIGNIIAAQQFDTAYNLSKLSRSTSRDEWLMPPQIVNAYNDASRLVICFPGAILQPPFFDPKAPIAANLGGIGTVIGHELTHGFDDRGCQFDAEGNVHTWQTKRERQAFSERAQILIRHADTFEVLPGLYLKGQMVIGETIADLGGIEISFATLRKKLAQQSGKPLPETFSAQELFFITYAITECVNTREALKRMLVASDHHPIARFRVNGVLGHCDGFYETFHVRPDDALYRTLLDRAVIW